MGGIGPDGIVEAKYLHVTKGRAGTQDMTGFGTGWKSGSQLFWSPKNAGEQIDLELKDVKAGKYKISARYTAAADYGIVQLSVNGTPVGPPTDLYGDKVEPAPLVDLGTVDLKDDVNTLNLKTTARTTNRKISSSASTTSNWFQPRDRTGGSFRPYSILILTELRQTDGINGIFLRAEPKKNSVNSVGLS